MKKVLEFLKEHGTVIILLFVLILFYRTCGLNAKIENNHKTELAKIALVDSMARITPKKVLIIEEINQAFEIKMWKFLELEELADKNGISVLELKHNSTEK